MMMMLFYLQEITLLGIFIVKDIVGNLMRIKELIL